MPVTYKWSLDRSPKKHICPGCGKKTFTMFVDSEGNHAPDIYGRCDREINCGYFARPDDERIIVEPRRVEYTPPSYTRLDDVRSTLTGYQQNALYRFLGERFGREEVNRLFADYMVGVDQANPGTRDWAIFWQFDIDGNCRGGKMIRYKPDGHRDHAYHATWHHACNRDRYPDYNLVQCFFGEHLLRLNPMKKAAIVESEKTAVIAAFFLPEYVWLSCGGKGGLGRGKCGVLRNRNVTLFPDLGAYDDWRLKASEYGFTVSRMIEDMATEEQRQQGLDLADFLI